MGKIFLLLFALGTLGWAQNPPDARPAAEGNNFPKPVVNVMKDCGAKGDGVTDDSGAINDCFEKNRSKTLVFPAGVYFAASDIVQVGSGTIAHGAAMPRSNIHMTGTAIKFGQGAGWKIGTQDSSKDDCQACVLENIGMVGPNVYTGLHAHECIIPAKDGRGKVYGNGLAASTDLTDGVTVNSVFVTVRNVWSGGFARYGFRCNGNSTTGAGGGWCDNSGFENTLAWGNRGSGYFVSGSDSNAAHLFQTRSYFAEMWGFELYAFLGITTVARSAHTNHVQQTKGGPPSNIITISGSGNSATLVTTTPISDVSTGNIIVLAGTDNWNGAYAVSAYDGHRTYTLKSLLPSPAIENIGTARLATCDEAWIATGVDGGGVKNNAGAVATVELNPYNEMDNGAGATGGGAAKYSPSQSIVIAGDQGPGFDVSGGNAPAAWLTTDISGFEIIGGTGFRNFVDNKHLGDNKITLGRGFNGREPNNSVFLIQDMNGDGSPKYGLEWRKVAYAGSPWYGLRTYSNTDYPSLFNYSILFGYGPTKDSCVKGETAPGCSRPKIWLPNGFYMGNIADGARNKFGQTKAIKPSDETGVAGDWMFNTMPTFLNSTCAAWIRQYGGIENTWRCVPFDRDGGSNYTFNSLTTSVLTLSPAASPNCNADHRGQLSYLAGSAGVKDIVEVCVKDSSDHYFWHAIY